MTVERLSDEGRSRLQVSEKIPMIDSLPQEAKKGHGASSAKGKLLMTDVESEEVDMNLEEVQGD